MQVAKGLGTYHIAILTNCAQELSFYSYVSTIHWKTLLSPWVEYSSKDLQLQARLLCSYVASSMDANDLLILDMDRSDLDTLLTMLGSASTSTELKASGFGFSFSATEILESLLHLFISQKNILSVLGMDIIPTILSLLLNGQLFDKLFACQLLWILLGEPNFLWDKEFYSDSIEEILTTLLEDKNESVQALSKLLLSEPCFWPNGKNYKGYS